MSEDLRYYFFDHEADELPPISCDEGWKNMQKLLNKEMPVTTKRRRRFFFFILSSVACIGLVTAIFLKNHFTPATTQTEIGDAVEKQNSIAPEKNNNLNSEQLTQKENNSSASTNNALALSLNDITKSIQANDRFSLENTNNNTIALSKGDRAKVLNDISPNKNISSTVESAYTKDQTLVDDTAHIVLQAEKKNVEKEKLATEISSTSKKQSTKIFNPRWQLNAGLGMNISFQNSLQSLRPYPYAELKYSFSQRFFASASLALFSPVGTKASGVEKTVYINDTSFDVSRYNKMQHYKRLDYADLALTAGIKINSKLSIQTGMQVSRLLYSSTGTSLDPYDLNSNLIRTQGLDVTTLPVTPSYAPVYNNTINVQNYDVRYLAGINYNLKKLSFSLQYQAAINPVLKGTIVSGYKNKMITLKTAYRFK